MNDDVFLHETRQAKVPFWDVIEAHEGFLSELYSQYKQAERKPCFLLYRRQFLSDKEVSDGLEEAHAKIPSYPSGSRPAMASFISLTDFERKFTEIHNEFWEKVTVSKSNENERGVFDTNYSCPDIEKTLIVTTLRNIENQYNLFLNPSLVQEVNYLEVVKLIASNIFKYSSDLGVHKDNILREIIKIGDPPFVYLMKKGGFGEWEKLRGLLEALWFPVEGNNIAPEHQQRVENPTVEPTTPPATRKYTDKHYALTYIFDLLAKNEGVPVNDAGLAATKLRGIGREITGKESGEGFYRAVDEIIRTKKYNLTDKKQLNQISNNWYQIITELSKDRESLINYLGTNGLHP